MNAVYCEKCKQELCSCTCPENSENAYGTWVDESINTCPLCNSTSADCRCIKDISAKKEAHNILVSKVNELIVNGIYASPGSKESSVSSLIGFLIDLGIIDKDHIDYLTK